MAPRRMLGCLQVAALAVGLLAACKDNGATAKLDQRCVQLAKLCGDKGKHVEKIVEECKQAAKRQVEKGCMDKVTAAYDCYERELCGKTDKVWALDDLEVLADRKHKCVTERDAGRACVKN